MVATTKTVRNMRSAIHQRPLTTMMTCLTLDLTRCSLGSQTQAIRSLITDIRGCLGNQESPLRRVQSPLSEAISRYRMIPLLLVLDIR